MLKRGITKRGAFERSAVVKMISGQGWWPVGLTLLAEVQSNYRDDDEHLLEVLYANTSGGHGVHKMTRRGRMCELDARLSLEISARFAGLSSVLVHDMACSNAITSLELYRSLSVDLPVQVDASDYFDELWLVNPPGSMWTVVFDVDGRALQFVADGLVISASHREPYRYPVNGILRAILLRMVLPRAVAVLKGARNLPGLPEQDQRSAVRRLRLFHPKCIALAEEDARFSLGHHDVFGGARRRYHVVRVMNALTLHHFPAERVRVGIRAACAQLLPGGVLILGRSSEESDGAARASAYLWDGVSLSVLWETNGGYEWPQLVAAVNQQVQVGAGGVAP